MPESMITFISGIFISVSTGIFTCAIPDGISEIGVYYTISAILMFIASLSLMLWAVIIQPIHDDFAKDPFYGQQGENNWGKYISVEIRKKKMIKIHICFFATIISILASVILWVIA